MSLRNAEQALVALLAAAVAVTAYGLTQVSGQVAIHFDVSGQPTWYVSAVPGLLVAPALAVVVALLVRVLPRIDPFGANFERFLGSFEWFMTLVVGLLVYVQTVLVLWNTGTQINVAQFTAPMIAAAYYAAGVLFDRAERNWFVGIRTPWTLSDERVWDRTHERAAPLFKIAGLFALGAIVWPTHLVAFAVAPAVTVTIYATVYSYLAYRRLGTGDPEMSA